MDHAAALKLLQTAMQHHQAGRLDEAEPIYRRVLDEQPHNVDALHLMGVLQSHRGKAEVGLVMLQNAAALMPQFAENWHDLGSVLAVLGRHPEPRNASVRADVGASLLALDRVAEALEQTRIAAQLEPNRATVVANYGYLLCRAGQLDAAVNTLKRALELDPACAAAWGQLGETLWRGAKYPEAVEPARRAVELSPSDPRLLLLLGNTLQTAGELEEAAAAYRRSIEIDPNCFDPRNNLALTLLKMGDAREAARMYEEIRARWPQGRDAWANQALTLLTLGDFENGLLHYEARMSSGAMEADRRAGKLWDGSDPRGRTFLLASEQGFGDTIQFVRYATLIADRGATVIVGCPVELVSLVSTVRGITRVVPVGSAMPQYDLIAPMASMPKAFGTRIGTIPHDVPYLSADRARVEQWETRFAGDANIKVGIAWAGSPAHQNDRARSCKLIDFAPVTAVGGVTFYSLQKGPAAEELKSAPADMKIIPLGHELNDFGDTAALLSCLDLLISVDTSIVHLAGALARPVWTLIARGPDWRWMVDREDTPWYPTMRLFRQQTLKQWRPVLERAAGELQQFVAAKNAVKE